MPDLSAITRRSALIGAGAGGGALLLAACSSGKSASTGTTATATTATATAASAGSAAAGTTIVALSAVPVGKAVSAKDKDGGPLIVAQPSAGEVVAFSAVCPHQQCTVAPASSNLECPCHHSKFETLTGALLHGPATTGLTKVAVSVVGGNVVQS